MVPLQLGGWPLNGVPSELVVGAYLPGDLAQVRNTPFDPAAVLGIDFEQQADGLWTLWRGTDLLGVFGYAKFMPGVMGIAMVLDRVASAGHGREIAAVMRRYIRLTARAEQVHRVEATCAPSDRVAAVFLRAIGMRQESVMEAGAPDGSDLLQFKLIIRGEPWVH